VNLRSTASEQVFTKLYYCYWFVLVKTCQIGPHSSAFSLNLTFSLKTRDWCLQGLSQRWFTTARPYHHLQTILFTWCNCYPRMRETPRPSLFHPIYQTCLVEHYWKASSFVARLHLWKLQGHSVLECRRDLDSLHLRVYDDPSSQLSMFVQMNALLWRYKHYWQTSLYLRRCV